MAGRLRGPGPVTLLVERRPFPFICPSRNKFTISLERPFPFDVFTARSTDAFRRHPALESGPASRSPYMEFSQGPHNWNPFHVHLNQNTGKIPELLALLPYDQGKKSHGHMHEVTSHTGQTYLDVT